MKLDAILCNHAEAVNNLLYVAGGGVNAANVPPGSNPPYAVVMGIGLIVTVPWGSTNQQHTVEIALLTEDGEPVRVPTGPDTVEPIQMTLAFNVGRGPNLTPGDDQNICLATNFGGLPLPAFGKYVFGIRLDGSPERDLPFRLLPMPGAQMAFGPGLSGGSDQPH